MEIITGYTGKKHITAEMDRDVNIGIVGGDSYVLVTGSQLEAEVSSNNEIKIKDGVVMHQGCAGSIKKNTYDSITISNGSQGMKRIDLLVLRYERNQDTNIELLTLKVLQGTPAESSPTIPQYTVGDIQSGDSVSDMPLYEIELDGINVTEVRKVFKMCMTNADLSDKIEQFDIISGGELTMYPDREQTFGKFIKKSGKLVEIWINAGVTKQIENGHKIADIPKGYWPGTTFNIFVPTGTKDYPVTVNSNGSVTALAAIPVSTTIRIHEFYFTK